MKVSAIVPAFNEARCIKKTLCSLGQSRLLDEIVVVDDGSRDGTHKRVHELGDKRIRLLLHAKNRGKGAALNTGCRAARGDIYLFVDADMGRGAVVLEELLIPVLSGVADMVIARLERDSSRPGGLGLACYLARLGIRHLAGLSVHEPLSGQRALRREVVEAVGGIAQRFGAEVALTIDAARKGFCIQEREVELSHSGTGRSISGFKHRGRQFVDISRVLAHRWKRRREGKRRE